MRLLAVGDVCGPVGCERIKQSLPVLKREKKIDVAVVNGENSADGNGILPESADLLFACGADVITGGNHSLRRKQICNYLDENKFILRPPSVDAVTSEVKTRKFLRAESKSVSFHSLPLYAGIAVSPFSVPLADLPPAAAEIIRTAYLLRLKAGRAAWM